MLSNLMQKGYLTGKAKANSAKMANEGADNYRSLAKLATLALANSPERLADDLATKAKAGAVAYSGHLAAEQAEAESVKSESLRTLAEAQAQRNRGAVTFRDGRKMHFWPATGKPGFPGTALAIMDVARRQGAVLVADGDTLILVEPDKGLSACNLADAEREAAGIIQALRGEQCRRR